MNKKISAIIAAIAMSAMTLISVIAAPACALADDGNKNEEQIIKQIQDAESKPAKPNADAVPDGMPSLKPNILVTGYSYDGSSVAGGQQFNFSFTLFNTSKSITVRNMVVKLKGGEDFALANGTDTIYVESLGYQESVTRNMNFTASMASKTGGHPIIISLAYEYYADGAKADGTTELTVSVPVVQQDKVAVTNVAFSSREMFQNEEYDVNYKVVNTGVTKILNATAHLVDSAGKELSSAFVGTVEPGTEAKNVGSLSAVFPNIGEQTLLFKLTYENEKMEPQEISQPLSANITEYVNKFAEEIPSDMSTNEQIKEPMSPIAIIGIAAGIMGVAAGGIIAIVVHSKRKKRRLLEDEDI